METIRLVVQKLLLLLLIIIVPGGLLIALSIIMYRRKNGATLMGPTLAWTPAILRSTDWASKGNHRNLDHWRTHHDARHNPWD